jgi:hypothetical protein
MIIALFYSLMRRPKQGELPLHRGTWGGRRPGAGRTPGPNPRVLHRSRERFLSRYPCLVTLKVRPGLASLRTVAVVQAIEEAFRRGGERGGAFRLVHYSVQGDHLHALVEASGREALGRGMMGVAIRFARAVNRGLGRSGRVLADRYHLRVLRTPTQVRNAIRYVLLNARRHAAKRRGWIGDAQSGGRRGVAARSGRGLPGPVRLDPASSSRWFSGWRAGSLGAEALARAPDAPAVRPARTWLLAVGWRRLGLLDPADVPG